ncbi:MAG: hypothetical protein LBJ20_04380 [Candidatus Methanoplasma sp.]|jgi:tetratricopeptide (TPR) repeat protein|nr:hypothetical protein [Candidatus Methanoplasma sp.]
MTALNLDMPSFDEHLEAILEDCNERVNRSEESGGSAEEYLDALIDRGSILSMMEYYTSAVSDFDDAIEIISKIEREGRVTDAGMYVRAFISRGELHGTENPEQMAGDYAAASLRLHELGDGSKYYDRKKMINKCLDCCEDLIDAGYPGEVSVFIDKLYVMLAGHDDNWSKNRYVEMLNLSAQAMIGMKMDDRAFEFYSDAIEEGSRLLEKDSLEDLMSLIFPFVSRGDIEQERGLFDQYFADRKAAISLLEELMSMNKLDDVQLLSKLHQDVANTYLTLNKVKEAEEHLMREVMLNMDGAEEYIREYTDRNWD